MGLGLGLVFGTARVVILAPDGVVEEAAVGSPQRRAGDKDDGKPLKLVDDVLSQLLQPVSAVFIGQGLIEFQLVDIGRRVRLSWREAGVSRWLEIMRSGLG
jgi:hypothetical protein